MAARRYELLVAEISGVRVIPIPEGGELVVGRSSAADVRLRDPSISRRHARFATAGGALTVEDLGSDNGTVISPRTLPDGTDVPTADLSGRRIEPGVAVPVDGQVMIKLGAVSVAVRAVAADVGPIVSSPAMRRLHELARRVADSRLPVLILGETGVGKESLARIVHDGSPRANARFVALNCAGVVETLFESELFGHVRGAFTGAHADKPGLLEAADGGTLFLDEVGELPASQQAKLLRVLEDGVITRVGALEPLAVDVRLVTATNRDLAAEIDAGAFRRDLYFRLSGVVLKVPPLRERRDEIAILARHFAAGALLGDAAVRRLEAHPWPGNVRELRQAIDRAVVLAGGGVIGPEHLLLEPGAAAPAPKTSDDARARAREIVDDAERAELVDALTRCGGNQTRAAELLGISRRTLVRRLSRHQLPRPRKSDSDD